MGPKTSAHAWIGSYRRVFWYLKKGRERVHFLGMGSQPFSGITIKESQSGNFVACSPACRRNVYDMHCTSYCMHCIVFVSLKIFSSMKHLMNHQFIQLYQSKLKLILFLNYLIYIHTYFFRSNF